MWGEAQLNYNTATLQGSTAVFITDSFAFSRMLHKTYSFLFGSFCHHTLFEVSTLLHFSSSFLWMAELCFKVQLYPQFIH